MLRPKHSIEHALLWVPHPVWIDLALRCHNNGTCTSTATTRRRAQNRYDPADDTRMLRGRIGECGLHADCMRHPKARALEEDA